MPRKIKIQTVDKTNLTNLENTLNETLCKKHVTISGPEKTIVVSNDTAPCSVEEFKTQLEREREDKKEIRKELNQTKKIIEKLKNENTGDAIASTNNDDDSTVVNIQDIKLKKCIDKFKDIILDVTTDDFTDNMSINEKIIKTSRRDGIILEEVLISFSFIAILSVKSSVVISRIISLNLSISFFNLISWIFTTVESTSLVDAIASPVFSIHGLSSSCIDFAILIILSVI